MCDSLCLPVGSEVPNWCVGWYVGCEVVVELPTFDFLSYSFGAMDASVLGNTLIYHFLYRWLLFLFVVGLSCCVVVIVCVCEVFLVFRCLSNVSNLRTGVVVTACYGGSEGLVVPIFPFDVCW